MTEGQLDVEMNHPSLCLYSNRGALPSFEGPYSSEKSLEFARKQLGLIREQCRAIKRELGELSKEDQEIGEAVAKMEEVSGIGFLTACGLSLFFKRRKVRRREEVAPLPVETVEGLDPVVRQSGKSEGPRRISRRGDRKLRALLYMAALSAIRVNKEIREFFQRLKERGKPGKVAPLLFQISRGVACMRKLALICWAHYKMALRDCPPFCVNSIIAYPRTKLKAGHKWKANPLPGGSISSQAPSPPCINT